MGDNSISKDFDMKDIMVTQNGIKDAQGEDRYGVVPGMTHHPRAGDNFWEAPSNLFFKIDDFYPVVRFYDDHKYQVFELGLKDPQGFPTVYCPEGTFRYQDGC